MLIKSILMRVFRHHPTADSLESEFGVVKAGRYVDKRDLPPLGLVQILHQLDFKERLLKNLQKWKN